LRGYSWQHPCNQRTLASLAITAAVIASTAPAAIAQAQARAGSAVIPSPKAPLLTTNRTLLASLARISRGSALWRDAIESVRQTGRHALIVTPDDPMPRGSEHGKDCEAFDRQLLAEVMPVLRDDRQIPFVVVVVNLPLVQEIHDARLSVPRDVEGDLDRILIHEVYGHAIPYLLAGNLSGRCADPRQGERPSDACAIRRENAVRAELGLGRRVDDSLLSLALSRGLRMRTEN
jgi:hypothetical protein